jgi:hypothetical protein
LLKRVLSLGRQKRGKDAGPVEGIPEKKCGLEALYISEDESLYFVCASEDALKFFVGSITNSVSVIKTKQSLGWSLQSAERFPALTWRAWSRRVDETSPHAHEAIPVQVFGPIDDCENP